MPKRWVHIQLPGYRQRPEHNTYESSRMVDLPPIRIKLDEDCEWLRAHGAVNAHGGLEDLAHRGRIQLPKSFRKFIKPQSLNVLQLDYVGHYATNKPRDLRIAWFERED